MDIVPFGGASRVAISPATGVFGTACEQGTPRACLVAIGQESVRRAVVGAAPRLDPAPHRLDRA